MRLHTGSDHDLDEVLARIQNDLFDVGSDFATPGPDEGLSYEPLRAVQTQVDWLETTIDNYNERLKPLKSFTLPAAAHSQHICICPARLSGAPNVLALHLWMQNQKPTQLR